MKKSQFRGYLLEDAVQKLLARSGYSLITSENEEDIRKLHNGLNVIGRGACHQFDSLGKIKWTPPFVYPIRLFVEAKYREKPIGVEIVRQGVGIIADVNQNYATVDLDDFEMNLPRYDYHYAIFSASGFTDNAVRMAVAHKIHLIDLRGEEYADLINAINAFVENSIQRHGNNGDIAKEKVKLLRDVFRNVINLTAETLNYDSRGFIENITIEEKDQLEEVKAHILKIGNLYLATANTPYLFGLTPYDNEAFIESLLKNPNQEVSITWRDESEPWNVIPKDESYKLNLNIPKAMKKYIFNSRDDRVRGNAINAKEKFLFELNFIADLYDNDDPRLFKLKYSSNLTNELVN